MRAPSVAFLPLLAGITITGQAQRVAPPTCESLLTALRSKVETNYAGFHLEVRNRRDGEYETLTDSLTRTAERTPRDDCYSVLQRFTEWFGDPHLFVFQSTRIDSSEAVHRAQNLRRTGINESLARAELERRAVRRDAIEGIWYDGSGLRVAVLPDPEARGRFMGVVVTSDSAAWPVGAVRATFTPVAGAAYAVELSARNFAVRHLTGRIHKEVLLRLSPGIWAREFPAPQRAGLVHSDDPRRPTLMVVDSTVVVSLASHDPAYASVVDSLVKANAQALRSAKHLIIDLRGNEGGSSWITNPLLPYIRSDPARERTVSRDTAVMLSSPDQIAYTRRAFGADTSTFVRELLRRLTANPGDLVPLPESFDTRRDSLVLGSATVGVLVDRGTVSAAEVLVLRAKESTRATVFGEATAGALDYQSTNVVRILPDENRWLLGYPTITASRHLPRGGMRGRGIAPDVAIAVTQLWDAIAEVQRRLTP